MSTLRQLIRESITQVDGKIFTGVDKMDELAKQYYEDRYVAQLTSFPQIPPRSTGLEVGLSGGILALTLKKLYKPQQFFAIEHPVSAQLYTKEYLKLIKQNNITLKTVDLRTYQYPWKDHTFDFIVVSEVIEHLIPADLPGIIGELTRMLKKDGQLIVTTPNIASLLKRVNLLRGKNPIEFDLTLHENATYGHIREYTMAELTAILQKAGLKVTKQEYYQIDAQRSFFTRLEDLSAKIVPSLGNNLLCVGTK